MKLICALLAILLLIFVSDALPTQTSMYYSVSEKLEQRDGINVAEEQILGKECDSDCTEKLMNTECNETTNLCECEENFPVQLSKNIGCAKPALYGEQCLYSESCIFNDPFSTCLQVSHKAYCQCLNGYHAVQTQKNSRVFCSKDSSNITKNVPALLIVISGVAVFSTLICFGLKLFAGKSHRYENSAITTRLLSTSEIAQMARSMSQSNRRATFSRRGSRGVTVSSSRETAARAAAILLVSCKIPPEELNRKSSNSQIVGDNTILPNTDTNSPRSFSAKQFKRENDMKIARNRQLCNQSQSSTSSLDQCSSLK